MHGATTYKLQREDALTSELMLTILAPEGFRSITDSKDC